MCRTRPSDKTKERVRKRDGYTCQNCHREGGPIGNTELHIHHVVPLSDGGSNKTSNLKTLCKDCHNAIHHNGKEAPTREKNINTPTKESQNAVGGKIFTIVYISSLLIFSSIWVSEITPFSMSTLTITSIAIGVSMGWWLNKQGFIED